MSKFSKWNQQAFDDLANSYDTEPWQQKLSAQLTQAIQDRLDWLGVDWATPEKKGKDVRLLDYACGTGLVSRALGTHVTTIRGIDISPNMVNAFNARARAAALPESRIHAVQGDLFAPSSPTPAISDAAFRDFDVAVVCLGFHHFEDPELAVARLVERLRPGGVVLIVDFVAGGGGHRHGHQHGHGHDHPDDHSTGTAAASAAEADTEQQPRREHQHEQQQQSGDPFQAMRHTIKHDGFDEQTMRALFDAAGLEEFAYDVLAEPIEMKLRETVRRKVFFAKGRKGG
ncbi:hypothetical protein LTR50_004578 [Elasticomyces elasticus]|nr:hypothetical protein LTR50_004578 [Elasticomyces elasticus]